LAGDTTGALRLLKQVLADQLRILGPNHPQSRKSQRAITYWAEMTE
jgi:hypothetical protein